MTDLQEVVLLLRTPNHGFIQCCLQFVYFVFQSSKGLLISEHYGAQFFNCTKEINKYY